MAVPSDAALPGTFWRVSRETRIDDNRQPRVLRTLEDTPFYARSLLATHLLDEPIVAVHESLSLDRFRAPWVQALLPFRMPRRRR
jgi:carotenoid 1,2-hydratase